jgi:hypothetical protein
MSEVEQTQNGNANHKDVENKEASVHLDIAEYLDESKKVSSITKVLWWCAGADAQLLLKCPYYDRVKYAGIGGIVLTTGVLAGFSGSYAFYTIFGPKGNAIEGQSGDYTSLIASVVFGIIWGLVILNFDRFIVSSTGKGDGTEKITFKELRGGLPRIIIALILGMCISTPLEIRILQSEINAELQGEQNRYLLELNSETDSIADMNLVRLEEKLLPLQANINSIDNELERRRLEILKSREKLELEAEGRSGSGVPGRGPAYRDKRDNLDKLEAELEIDRGKKESEKAKLMAEIGKLQSDIEAIDGFRLNEKSQNVERSKSLDGLLKRIEISHEIGGVVPWMIMLLILCIEMGPIFFKMMLIKSPYDFLKDNFNERVKAKHGIISETHFYPDGEGGEEAVKHRFLEVESDSRTVKEKLDAQEKLNKEIIQEYEATEGKRIKDNPDNFYTRS